MSEQFFDDVSESESNSENDDSDGDETVLENEYDWDNNIEIDRTGESDADGEESDNELEITNGKYFRQLMRLPLDELESHPTGKIYFCLCYLFQWQLTPSLF